MENAGCVSVDNAGFNKAAVGKFEKLMIFNCPLDEELTAVKDSLLQNNANSASF